MQSVGIVRHLLIGKSLLSPLSFVYLALLMSTCGMLGAMLERRAAKVRVAQEELRRRSGSPGEER